MNLLGDGEPEPEPVRADEREDLLVLAEQLAQPRVSDELRLEIARSMRRVLERSVTNENGRMWLDHPPPPSVSVG